jgi:hypothetical protein
VDLAAKISTDTNFLFDHTHRPSRGDADLFEQTIWAKFKQDQPNLDRYTEASRRLSAAISSTVSIDDALHQLSDYPEAVTMGKVCIIRSILTAERKSELKIDPTLGQPKPEAGRQGWIEHLFSMAITGFKLSEIEKAFSNITIVNFNYDRCIEHYVYWSLQRIGLSEQESSNIVSRMNILRPYGTLGSIMRVDDTFLQFGESRRMDLFAMVDRIRTFTEAKTLHDTAELRRALSKASLVIYLGFGFHPQNLKLLSLVKSPANPATKVLATTFKVDDANVPELKSALAKSLLVGSERIETRPMAASELLQKLRIKIQLAVG